MKKINPIFIGLVSFFGCMLFVFTSDAQHVLESGGSRKVIKVVKEHGGALYYQIWPDTTDGDTRAILVSDITSLEALTYSEVDSAIAAIQHKKVVAEHAIVVEQHKTVRHFFIPAVGSSFRTDQFNYNISAAYALLHQSANLYGMGIGYDRVNQGQAFILLNMLQLRFFYNRYFTSTPSSKRYYCGAEFSVGKTLSGKYNNAWLAEDMSESIKMKKEHLGYSVGLNAHIGVDLKDRFLIEMGLLYRNLGIVFPDDTKKYVLGELRVGYKI